MRIQNLFYLVFLVFFTAAVVLFFVRWLEPDPLARWQVGFETASDSARENGRYLLAYFARADSEPSRSTLHRVLRQLEETGSFPPEIDRVRIEWEQVRGEGRLADQLSIEGPPTLTLFAPDGREVARFVGEGSGDSDALLEWLETAWRRSLPEKD